MIVLVSIVGLIVSIFMLWYIYTSDVSRSNLLDTIIYYGFLGFFLMTTVFFGSLLFTIDA